MNLLRLAPALPALLAAGAEAAGPAVRAQRSVRFAYLAEVPANLPAAHRAELWLPLPAETAHQRVTRLEIASPLPWEILTEPQHGNRLLRVRGPAERLAGVTVSVGFDVTRRALLDAHGETGRAELERYRSPNRLVPAGGVVAERAERAAAGETEPLRVARALYDDVVSSLRYDKSLEGWGRGDAVRACTVEAGNCTDFHSLFIGMCRARGIPARFLMGVALPLDRSQGTLAGYHCWAEFHVPGTGWLPVDASEASRHPERAEFLFGHLDPDRIEFTRGRDLQLPGTDAVVNYLIDPVLLLDGRLGPTVRRRFEFRDLDERSGTG